MPKQAQAVRDLAAELYERIAPALGCHSPCRELALIALGICAARGIAAELHYEPRHDEGGIISPHYLVRLSDGCRIDCWQRQVRLHDR